MQFTVTPAQLDSFASYCQIQSMDIQLAVTALGTLVSELCSAPYVGPASHMLMIDMEHVSTEAKKLHMTMDTIVANLHHNSKVYGDGETQNVTNLQAATAAIAAAS
jgi:hypothetical protein